MDLNVQCSAVFLFYSGVFLAPQTCLAHSFLSAFFFSIVFKCQESGSEVQSTCSSRALPLDTADFEFSADTGECPWPSQAQVAAAKCDPFCIQP